jgi:hypothetical protein
MIYGSAGTPEENAWALAKARFDADQWWYRANGYAYVLRDDDAEVESLAKNMAHNVILYGNADTNRAWRLLMPDTIRVSRGEVRIVNEEGEQTWTGDDLGVLLAHSEIKKFELPDAAGQFDRYKLKLVKQNEPLVKEWADALLFGNWKTQVAEKDNGKERLVGGKTRVLFCNRSAAYDAKNRYGLPAEIPMEIEALAPLFADVPAPASTPKPKGWRDRIAEATTNDELRDLRSSVRDSGESGKLTKSQCETLFDLIEERMNSFTPEDVHHDAPAEV